MLDRAIALAGVAAVVIFGTVAIPDKYAKWRGFGYLVGLTFAGLAFFALLWPDSGAVSTATLNINGNDNCTINGNGNTVTCGNHIDPLNPILNAKLATIADLESFIGGKNDSQLNDLFDFPGMIDLNIKIAKLRLENFNRTGRPDLDLSQFRPHNEDMRLNIEIAGTDLTHTSQGGGRLVLDPHKLALIVLTQKYLDAMQSMKRFTDSTKLPLSVINQIKSFASTIDENLTNMQVRLSETLQKSPEAFLQSDDTHSPYWRNAYMDAFNGFIPLKPKADGILNAIRSYEDGAGSR